MSRRKKDFPYKKGMHLVSKYYKPAKIVKITDIRMSSPGSYWGDTPIFYLKGKNRSVRYGIDSMKRDFRPATLDEIRMVGILYE